MLSILFLISKLYNYISLFSISNAAYNEEADSASASAYTAYPPNSAPADVSPSWATNSWTNE